MVVMKTLELRLRTVISANKLSIYGAVAELCDEVPKGIRAPVKPAAPDHLEKIDIPTDLSIAENSTNAQQRWNLVQEYERKFEQLSEDQKLSKLCSDTIFEACRTRTTLQNLWNRRRTTDATFMRRIHDASQWKGTWKRWRILKFLKIGPLLNLVFLVAWITRKWYGTYTYKPDWSWDRMERRTQRFQGSAETCSTWSFGKDGNYYRLFCSRKL